MYEKIKLQQMRDLHDDDPKLLLASSQFYQFCVSCDRVIRKYNSGKCQHLSCEYCMLTFCMYCREIIHSSAPGRKHQSNARDHFNPFSLNSCKMKNSNNRYKSY